MLKKKKKKKMACCGATCSRSHLMGTTTGQQVLHHAAYIRKENKGLSANILKSIPSLKYKKILKEITKSLLIATDTL
jgi:hypothetical protein